jgi:hypothetical protein
MEDIEVNVMPMDFIGAGYRCYSRKSFVGAKTIGEFN